MLATPVSKAPPPVLKVDAFVINYGVSWRYLISADAELCLNLAKGPKSKPVALKS